MVNATFRRILRKVEITADSRKSTAEHILFFMGILSFIKETLHTQAYTGLYSRIFFCSLTLC